eukprot:TRINITY_DN2625_c2_g1_i1.p1 TRINITY_DN2625_c2_g1~~TRINITY_DN2625_c2_g1_i1.p1  ORF type:complete len:391 (+),score=82.08 TRINITY_DN2625_c2_g1_i1:55-1227(+)
MRIAALITMLAACEGYLSRSAKPRSDMTVSVNNSVTYLSSFRNTALDSTTGFLIPRGRDPRFPNGGGAVNIVFDSTTILGQNGQAFANGVATHTDNGRAGDNNPAHTPSTVSSSDSYTPGNCYASDMNASTDSNVALNCDFSHAYKGCKGVCSTTTMEIDVQIFQSLEMTSRGVPTTIDALNTNDGRDTHCAFGITTASSSTSKADTTTTQYNPAGVTTDYSDGASNCSAATDVPTDPTGTLVTAYKVTKIKDSMFSNSAVSTWVRIQFNIDSSNGFYNVSFKNSSNLWEEGWPGDEEIHGLRFCNYDSRIRPEYLECITQTFPTNYVKGSVTTGDASSLARDAENAERVYIYAQGTTQSTGTLIIDFRLDVGDYIVLPSIVTHAGSRRD